MLDIISNKTRDYTYGPKTKRQLEDDITPILNGDQNSKEDGRTQQNDVENISQFATDVLDKVYGWEQNNG